MQDPALHSSDLSPHLANHGSRVQTPKGEVIMDGSFITIYF